MKKIMADEIVSKVVNSGQTAMAPRPFAGKYPTRIKWTVTLSGRRTKIYCGKPTRLAVETMLKYATRPDMVAATFVEVDTVNLLSSFYGERRNFADRRATIYIGWNVYHPFTSDSKGWEWLLRPWWRKKLLGRIVYSPIENPSAGMHIEPYTAWYKSLTWHKPAPVLRMFGDLEELRHQIREDEED